MEPGTNWQMIHKDVEKSNNSPWHTHTHTYTERENTHGQDVSSRVWLATRGQLYTLPVSFFLPYLISIMTLKVSWRWRALMRVHATKKKKINPSTHRYKSNECCHIYLISLFPNPQKTRPPKETELNIKFFCIAYLPSEPWEKKSTQQCVMKKEMSLFLPLLSKQAHGFYTPLDSSLSGTFWLQSGWRELELEVCSATVRRSKNNPPESSEARDFCFFPLPK